MPILLLILNDNLPSHALDDLCIKLDGVVPREANLLGQVVGQNVDEVAVALVVEQGLVGELGFLVAQARWGLGVRVGRVVADCQVEVQGCEGKERECQ